MGVLKRGSNGRPVEELQNLLNKFGVRPQLTVDGIFGPLTDAGLRSAQKKLRLRVDGVAGERTLAAVRYGRPLPVMEAQSFAGKTGELQASNKYNQVAIQSNIRLSEKIDEIDRVSDTERQIISKAFAAMATPQATLLKLVTQVEKMQVDFERLVLTKPALAEKYAKQCSALEPKIRTVAAQVTAQLEILGRHTALLDKAAQEIVKAIARDARACAKATKDYDAAMRRIIR